MHQIRSNVLRASYQGVVESAMEVNRGEQIEFKLQSVSVIVLAYHLRRSEKQHIQLHRNTNA